MMKNLVKKIANVVGLNKLGLHDAYVGDYNRFRQDGYSRKISAELAARVMPTAYLLFWAHVREGTAYQGQATPLVAEFYNEMRKERHDPDTSAQRTFTFFNELAFGGKGVAEAREVAKSYQK